MSQYGSLVNPFLPFLNHIVMGSMGTSLRQTVVQYTEEHEKADQCVGPNNPGNGLTLMLKTLRRLLCGLIWFHVHDVLKTRIN